MPGPQTPGGVTGAAGRYPLDDESASALALFNTYLVADREQQAHERAIKKAEKVKDEAAAAVRKLNERKAPASETAAAEAAYREAVQTLNRLSEGGSGTPRGTGNEAEDRSGDDADVSAAPEPPAEQAEQAATTTSDDTTAEQAATTTSDDTPSPPARAADGQTLGHS